MGDVRTIQRRWPALAVLALAFSTAACGEDPEPAEPEELAGLSQADEAACEQYIDALDERQEWRDRLVEETERFDEHPELADYEAAGKDFDTLTLELADAVSVPLLSDSLREAAETRIGDLMTYRLAVERIRGLCGGWLTVPS